MTLDEYITSTREKAAKFAAALNVPPSRISEWRTGVRPVPAERCPEIEKATGGAVTCEELRPDVDWAYLRCSCKAAGE